jgi:hypothetical protein
MIWNAISHYYIVEMLGSGGTGVVERRVVIADAN